MRLLKTLACTAVALFSLGAPAFSEETVKVGLIMPFTGPFATEGKQIGAAIKLYLQRNGDTVAGKKIEVIEKDDAGNADTTKRLAQELIVNDKVSFLAGFGLTPLALATAPVATKAKVPLIVMAAATSSITEASPFVFRTSETMAQSCAPLGDWAAKNGIKRVVTVVSDYAPGNDAEKSFSERFTKAGGTVENVRVPLRNPDFSPYLQKVTDAKPDAVFVFVPSGIGAQFMKQYPRARAGQGGRQAHRTGRRDRRRPPRRHRRYRARHHHGALLLGGS